MKSLLMALAACSACQTVRRKLDTPERQETEHWNGRVELTALRNERAAFGLPVSRKVVMGAAAFGLAALWTQRGRAPFAVGLALGGGLSNLLERVKAGAVYDYVRFPKAPKPVRNYVFNLADFAVFAGAIGLLFFGRKK